MGEVRNEWRPESAEIFISEIFYGRQAVFYEDSFSRIIWVGGVKTFPSKISSGAQSEDLGPSLTIQNKTNNYPSLNYGTGWACYLCGLGKRNGRPGGRFVPNFPHEPGFNPRRRPASVRGGGQNDHCSRGVLHQPLCSRIDRLKEI